MKLSAPPRTLSSTILLACAIAAPLLAAAQAPLPPPDQTNPVTLALMKGFPPPADKTVTLANVLRFPNTRWAYQHMRELGPTAAIARSAGLAQALPARLLDLGSLRFDDGKGAAISLTDWLKSTYTDGFLVLHQGRVVYEQLDAGLQPNQPHFLASMSKSFTGLLATQLIAEGLIDPKAKVAQYLPELADSAWADATVQQTLDMTTSVRYGEDFTNPRSEVFQYLIAGGLLPAPAGYPGPKAMPAFLKGLQKDPALAHGAGFQYKSVDTEVIGWLLQRVSGKPFAQLVSERLWQPIGASEDASVWLDPNGAQLTSVGLSASLRDLGRLGEMLRQDGSVNGKQVLPKAVVEELKRGADREAFKASGQTARSGYSYHNFWWIPHDADGSFEAKGLNGQHLHINPATQTVIVKLSTHPAGNTLVTHAVDARAFAALDQALRSSAR